MVFVLAVGGIFIFACIAHARHTAMMRVMRDAQRASGSRSSSNSDTESADPFGSSSPSASSFGSTQPDDHSLAHAKAHFGLNSHGEALVSHHGMDPHTASFHGGTDSGGIGGGGHNT